ncbi:MAG: tRNA pseudouridine(55) synthase TruB [Thermomicrobiales bacterium]|nr:tRNA pseudouridine(55) synthase TruB [Thermomicrobiales bacterium]
MGSATRPPMRHGFLVIDKAPGWTSHDVVARVRRLVGMKRVGHGGTLDPFATGVVIVAVGRATRLLQYVQDSDKRYLAHVVFGAATDTYDVDGEVTARSDGKYPSREDIVAALTQFLGEVEQVPPAYSAIKVDGKRLYARARAGEDVVAPTRRVRIDGIIVLSYDPPDLFLDIECGKGTYIRSIAHDLGKQLGCHAYCHGLRRVSSGGFSIDESWTLDELAERDIQDSWTDIALHPDRAVTHLNAAILDSERTASWYHGRSVELRATYPYSGDSLLRVYSVDGRFLGLGRPVDDGCIRPAFVFAADGE